MGMGRCGVRGGYVQPLTAVRLIADRYKFNGNFQVRGPSQLWEQGDERRRERSRSRKCSRLSVSSADILTHALVKSLALDQCCQQSRRPSP